MASIAKEFRLMKVCCILLITDHRFYFIRFLVYNNKSMSLDTFVNLSSAYICSVECARIGISLALFLIVNPCPVFL